MAYTPHGMARVTCVRPSAAGVSVAGACHGVDGCHVLCLLLGAPIEGESAGPGTPDPPSEGGSPTGRLMGADTGSARSADLGSDPPVASTCGLTNVLSKSGSEEILSGSTSSSGLRVLDLV